MKNIKHTVVLFCAALLLVPAVKQTQAQIFYIGVNGGAVYSWFDSPKLQDLFQSEDPISSDGWGWDLGFFLRYGSRPYFQAGFDWTRSMNDFRVHIGDQEVLNDRISFHNFDFSFKVGYDFIHLPMFRFKAHAGPFIGRSLLFSSDEIIFNKTDFRNPQWGFIAGTGIQFTNLTVDFEYSYHISDLFKPVDLGGGEQLKFGSHLQLITLKVGLIF